MYNQEQCKPKWRDRRGFRLLLMVLASVGLVALTPGMAQAYTVQAARYHYWGVPAATGYADWRAPYYNPFLHVSVTAAYSLPWNYCDLTGFDWKRNAGHYDARVARACATSAHRSSGDTTEPSGMQLLGMQKFGGCRGPGGYETNGTCVDTGTGDAEASIYTLYLNNGSTCVRQWSLWPDYSTTYVSGGNSTACNS